ncbi:hypothetical protein C5E45_08555 [Nocardia nova]|uniref:Uncharacterized protein n=1 Tax=Nocardia nova TaxID=37330 RepID=A0A2S6AUL3_9NOCA|nr:hypothetical protein [Nocardia nova]PPJ30762.1 hypothetical protein C5E41_07785 [Nocardia nova]PPJ38883.1 hypothetical protein C5E45_08555 [Nocardia nova]
MTTVLKMLLTDRHLTSYSDFLAEYDRCAAQLAPPVPPGYGPARTQFYQWLSGGLVGRPRDYHCRVLAEMFPGWTIEELFRSFDDAPTAGTARESALAATDNELAAFLGAEMSVHGVTLVYPTFELQLPPDKTHPAARRLHPSAISGKIGASGPGHSRNAFAALPENDVRALLYVASALQRRTSMSIDIRSDRDAVARNDRPYISFGLTCNGCTRLYLESTEHPLFTLHCNEAYDGPCPDRLELPNGTTYDLSGDHNIGLIARARPNPNLHPDRYWIFCAGSGSRGTAGASWYLANRWSLLQRRAGDREFVAVIAVGDNSDDTARIKHLMIDSAS